MKLIFKVASKEPNIVKYNYQGNIDYRDTYKRLDVFLFTLSCKLFEKPKNMKRNFPKYIPRDSLILISVTYVLHIEMRI